MGRPIGLLHQTTDSCIKGDFGSIAQLHKQTLPEKIIKEAMANLSIFVSFEFDKDGDLKNSFFAQAREKLPHRVRNSSLNEAYPNEEWMARAQSAIRRCDLVIVLVGQDIHNAPGVRTEVEIAKRLGKPVFQVIPQGRPYEGLPCVDDRIRWKWNRINRKIDEVWSRSQQG